LHKKNSSVHKKGGVCAGAKSKNRLVARGISEVGKKGLFDPSMIPLATSLISFPSAGHEIPRKYNKNKKPAAIQ
jgi:hypothetical protein